jgi:uncharacterized glyoxalase superfamily protein PhnB
MARIFAVTPLIEVFDMPRALAFYCGALGFSIVDASPDDETPEGRFPHWARLRLDGAELMLNTAYDSGERPPAPEPAREIGHRDLCLYLACDDVDSVFRALKGRIDGLAPPQDAPYGMRQLYLRDPDGYGLCFQAPIAARS